MADAGPVGEATREAYRNAIVKTNNDLANDAAANTARQQRALMRQNRQFAALIGG